MANTTHRYYFEYDTGKKVVKKEHTREGAEHSVREYVEYGIRFEVLNDDGDVEAKGKTTHVDDDSLTVILDHARHEFGATRLRYKEPDVEGQWQEY